MTIRFDTETIRLITAFENLTGAPVKDCIYHEDVVCFLIGEGKAGIAIGKNGNIVKNAEKAIGKSIKVFEFSKDLNKFVKKIIPQANMIKIRNEDEKIIVEVKVDKSERALVIGRERRNLKLFKELLERNHGVHNLVIK